MADMVQAKDRQGDVVLLRGAHTILTMDDTRRELVGADILLRGGVIAAIGMDLHAPEGCVVHEVAGCVLTPGLVNTHHHLYQSLTRAVPGGQDALLFGWLRTLYPIWQRFTPDHMFVSAQVGLAELALSGCTLSSDHLYLYPNGSRLEDTIHAAREIGLRFHPTRGAMSIGESAGGLPPDALVEQEEAILTDCMRVIAAFHDPAEGSMCRVGIAPCSPFSVSTDLMREAAVLARDKGVMLHTHLAENDEDIAYSLETFGCRPGEYAEMLGWVGPDVWHAHCVKLDAAEIALFAATGTGVAHCPCSNCRLGSGIAPLRGMRDAGVKVGLGVDGSASNDAGNLVSEARQAMLLQRVALGADAMSAREALEIATRGGADVLGRPDCGRLAVGKRADIAVWDVTGVQSAGSWDPAALLLAGPTTVRDLFVEGRVVVQDGQMTTTDMAELLARQRQMAQTLKETL
ncbi:8-oxoguanine deaminase [uncultured Sulfitobacter sp.]|uniref:8-oxoguanine deaminase n=1 Tax=uncultured Sulfitobacter sp. TaxID=191468 RepID=UPI00261ACB8A|nr:8-oxoguanine deaminase [uncultured Sulfitobacter sp.]